MKNKYCGLFSLKGQIVLNTWLYSEFIRVQMVSSQSDS